MIDPTEAAPAAAAPAPAPAKKPATKKKPAGKTATKRATGTRRHDAALAHVRNFLAQHGVPQSAYTDEEAAALIEAIDAA